MTKLKSMLRDWAVASALVIAGLAWAGPHEGQLPPSPPFRGEALAVAPQQKQAWAAPASTKLPDGFMSATAALFELGMADPRGCEYREIEVGTGSVWTGDAGVVKVHGWVIPAGAKGEAQRFAVAWNGLVYPVVKVGAKADLKGDVDATCAIKLNYGPMSGSEEDDVSEKSLWPINVCLLLRLGETALAEKMWLVLSPPVPPGGDKNENAEPPTDPFLYLAKGWLWSRFERVETAHMRGDDRLALLEARALTKVGPLAEAAAKRVKKDGAPAEEMTYFGFLSTLPPLLADQERRATEMPRAHVLAAPEKFPDQSKRIAGLIADLEEVMARQEGQPGPVELGKDPIVLALIHEGDAAVEPLLECLENDKRLTRSVHFGRSFIMSRPPPLGVCEPAYVALAGIMQRSFMNFGSTADDLSAHEGEERREFAKAIRAYYEKHKGMPREERWFETLSDDKASAETWREAAEQIVEPADQQVIPSSMWGAEWGTKAVREPGKVIPMAGEALRKKHDPSVAELLIKRVGEFYRPEKDPSVSGRFNGPYAARALVEVLEKWDGKNGADDLRKVSEVMRKGGGDPTSFARLYIKRVELGDDKALSEYVAWLETISPQQAATADFGRVFEPLWRYGGQPMVAAAVERLWKEGSAWNPVSAKSPERTNLLAKPLMGLAVVRTKLLRQLADKSAAGTAEVVDGKLTMKVGELIMSDTAPDDPLLPKAGEMRTFRVCDQLASSLSDIGGFPQSVYYWPEAQRDAAVARARAVLEQYGKRFEWSALQDQVESSPYIDPFGFESGAVMTFAAMDHLASTEEVAKGTAIFSLEGQHRVWPLPLRPMRVRWTTLHAMPVLTGEFDEATQKPIVVRSWAQEGYVWQAEEVLQDGKWQRWLGFVGPGMIGKAPAEEVELVMPDHAQWTRLGKGLEWRLAGPAVKEGGAALAVGDPLVAQLHVRNILGTEQSVAGEWYRPAEKAWRAGVQVHLEKTTGLANAEGVWNDSQWVEVPARGTKHFAVKEERVLAPAEESPIGFDLREGFAIEEPGTYRLWITGPKGPAAEQAVETAVVTFSVVGKGGDGK